MNSSQEVQNKPTAAYILSLIGGIFGLIGGLILVGLGAVAGVFTFGLGFVFVGGIGLWITICSIIVIIAASKLNSEPLEHSKWGAIILVFSIIGSWSLLNLIGGILALVYKPEFVFRQPQYGTPQPYGYAPAQQQPITRACPQCGRIVQANERFCPNCGKQLY
ncbi:MAG TPA: zinc ribbon domain-containing protein [Candidatus Binatia bacterium]|nr:zinc ribbon domain-containing protein [Candidatus Binatia bacterium]